MSAATPRSLWSTISSGYERQGAAWFSPEDIPDRVAMLAQRARALRRQLVAQAHRVSDGVRHPSAAQRADLDLIRLLAVEECLDQVRDAVEAKLELFHSDAPDLVAIECELDHLDAQMTELDHATTTVIRRLNRDTQHD